MINSTINDESFRLKITEIGLRKLLINKGSIEVLSYITSLYDEKNNEYIKLTDAYLASINLAGSASIILAG